MITNLLRLTICLFALMLVSACSTTRKSRNLAQRTAETVSAYEAQVNQKVSAEKAFYRDHKQMLRSMLCGPPAAEVDSHADAESTRQSIAFLRIKTWSERDARVAAGEIVGAEAHEVLPMMIQFIEGGVKIGSRSHRESVARQRRLQDDQLHSLEAISRQNTKLKEIRGTMAKLAKEPSLADDVQTVVEFGRALEAILDEEETKKAE